MVVQRLHWQNARIGVGFGVLRLQPTVSSCIEVVRILGQQIAEDHGGRNIEQPRRVKGKAKKENSIALGAHDR